MAQSIFGMRGIAVAPHSLAAESAVAVLREGGNALEAMIAAAATIAVVYPHMNSIGGDGFWVINGPNNRPGGIDASGRSAQAASRDWYASRGITSNIPFRGGVAALTVAGTISGWGAAHQLSKQCLNGKLPLSRLLSDARYFAQNGIAVTQSQEACTSLKRSELEPQSGFASTFLPQGMVPARASIFKQPKLADTLALIAKEGCDTFYRGKLAKMLAAELAEVGSPLTLADLKAHQAKLVDPLHTTVAQGQLFNMVPPSQGLLSLLILGIMDRIHGWDQDPEGAAFIHTQVEATKLAFSIRDQYLTDPTFMSVAPQDLLSRARIDALAAKLDTTRVLPHSGVNWQNRGCSFSLNPGHINTLEPGKKPFHTLNPALAQRADGGVMVYGAMGGDGQPQTQATIFNRVTRFGDHPQLAIERPRWLLGRTWGQSSDSLKLENRFSANTIDQLRALGHDVETIGAWDEGVGHAGMLIRHANGVLEGGFDPRSNGAVASF